MRPPLAIPQAATTVCTAAALTAVHAAATVAGVAVSVSTATVGMCTAAWTAVPREDVSSPTLDAIKIGALSPLQLFTRLNSNSQLDLSINSRVSSDGDIAALLSGPRNTGNVVSRSSIPGCTIYTAAAGLAPSISRSPTGTDDDLAAMLGETTAPRFAADHSPPLTGGSQLSSARRHEHSAASEKWVLYLVAEHSEQDLEGFDAELANFLREMRLCAGPRRRVGIYRVYVFDV
jgi:hypothetical protein